MVLLLLVGCQQDPHYEKLPQTFTVYCEEDCIEGVASYYGEYFHGRTMANGDIYNMYDMTAASPLISGTNKPKYEFGTRLKVTNVENNNSVEVTITDTGIFGEKYDRDIDLSKMAFSQIAELKEGVITVKIQVL